MRIPVVIAKVQPGAADALLIEGDATAPEGVYAQHFTLPLQGILHIAGCVCCTPRSSVSAALAAMFRARATGAAPFFSRVVVWTSNDAGAAGVAATLSENVLSSARYRLAAY